MTKRIRSLSEDYEDIANLPDLEDLIDISHIYKPEKKYKECNGCHKKMNINYEYKKCILCKYKSKIARRQKINKQIKIKN